MRFIVMHRTNAHWEAGAVPSPELIARVGSLLGEMSKAKVLLGGEGLRASSQGARLRRSGERLEISKGPFAGGNELPAGFSIVRAASLDEAVAWAARQAEALGDVEIDVRPVTEPWDIGLGSPPPSLATRRYMALRKATAATEAGEPLPPERRAALTRLYEETTRSGLHVATETFRPSRRGRRYKNSKEGVRVSDGPFTESKELIAGYAMLEAESLDAAGRWAARYVATVDAEADLRELDDEAVPRSM